MYLFQTEYTVRSGYTGEEEDYADLNHVVQKLVLYHMCTYFQTEYTVRSGYTGEEEDYTDLNEVNEDEEQQFQALQLFRIGDPQYFSVSVCHYLCLTHQLNVFFSIKKYCSTLKHFSNSNNFPFSIL